MILSYREKNYKKAKDDANELIKIDPDYRKDEVQNKWMKRIKYKLS